MNKFIMDEDGHLSRNPEYEKQLIDELGEDYFKVSKDEFIKLPEEMTAKQYKEWRKKILRIKS
jgi:hypothetical protein